MNKNQRVILFFGIFLTAQAWVSHLYASLPGDKYAVSLAACTIDSITGDTNVCAEAGFNFKAFASDSTVTFKWYADSLGGTPLFTGNPFISSSTTNNVLFVEAVDTMNQVCSPQRKRLAFTVIPTGPLHLSTISCVDVTTSQIRVKWESVPGAGAYYILAPNEIGGTKAILVKGDVNDTLFTNLKPGKDYTYSIYAIKANQNCQDLNGTTDILHCYTTSPNERDSPLPDAFSPNNDGKNETFGPDPKIGYTSFELIIYDRNGSILFNTKLKNQPWNGRLNNVGEEVPVGVYVYHLVITGAFKSNETKTYTGLVTLLR